MLVKTLEGFDPAFQPSLDRERIAALAQLDFVRRAEDVHFHGSFGHRKEPSRCLVSNFGDHPRDRANWT